MAVCNLVVTFARQYLSIVEGGEALGIYASVCTPIVLIQACSSYVYAPLLGVFAERLDRGDSSGFRRLFAQVLLVFLAIFVIGSVAFYLLGDWFLGVVFGSDIVPYGYLMYAALLSTSVTACIAFLADLLVTMRLMSWNLIGNIAACVASIPLTIFCVHSFGMNGVSYSIAISYATGSAIMCCRVIRGCRNTERRPA